MQAGSYIEQSQSDTQYLQRYVSEMATITDEYISPDENIMDVGTGGDHSAIC